MNPNRRSFLKLGAGASAGLLGLAGSANAATDSVIDGAPVVEDAAYPTVGTHASNPTATVFGNFKCPYTRQFVLGNFDDLIRDFVEPGRLNVQFRAVAYEPFPSDPSHGSADWYISSSDPRISEAGLGVWDVSPDDYWTYYLDMFQSQVSGYVTLDELVGRMADAGVSNRSAIRKRVAADRYADDVVRSKRTARDANLQWTPWMEFRGDTVSPHHGYAGLSDWVEARLPAVTADSQSTDSEEESSSAPASAVGEFDDVWTAQPNGDAWHSAGFDRSYDDPVVVMNGLAENGGHPSHTRLRNVGGDGFEYQIEEWEYLDGSHTAEKACYLAVEAGVHGLPGGGALEAGTLTGRNLWRGAKFDANFDRTPVVLSQAQTYNGYQSIVTRQRDVSTDGFDVFLQEEQASTGWHTNESIGYVAVTPGTDEIDGTPMEAGLTAERVTDDWYRVDFERSYSDPNFVASVQTINGLNPISVRYRWLTGSSVEIRVQEERSASAETRHDNGERVGFLVSEDA